MQKVKFFKKKSILLQSMSDSLLTTRELTMLLHMLQDKPHINIFHRLLIKLTQ